MMAGCSSVPPMARKRKQNGGQTHVLCQRLLFIIRKGDRTVARNVQVPSDDKPSEQGPNSLSSEQLL